MTHSARVPRSPRRQASRRSAGLQQRVIEQMEPRLLFHLELQQPIPDVTVNSNAAPGTVDLNARIFNEESGATVRLDYGSLGTIDVLLYERAAPLSVQNFLGYANNNTYDGTVIHRSEPGPPPFVIQGGGFRTNGTDISPPGTPTVPNEFSPSRSNLRGTLAYAKLGGDPNSATTEWFINLSDNSGNLDNQNGGFTVFGRVVNGMAVADAIAALPRVNATPINSAWNSFPVTRTTSPDLPARPATASPVPDQMVVLNDVSVVTPATPVTYTVVSNNNPDVVTPTITDGALTLTYAPGASGVANITVRGVESGTGATVEDTFQVVVGAIDVAVGTGAARSVAYTDADGTVGQITVNGGTATVRFTGVDLAQTPVRNAVQVAGTNAEVLDITVTGGAPTITVKGVGGDGRVVVNGINAAGTVKNFSGRPVILRGDTNIAGGLGRMELFRAEDATITLNGNAAPAGSTITILSAEDTELNSATPVRSLRFGSWTGTDGDDDTITAQTIGTLQSGGAFNGNVNVLGAVGNMTILGDLAGTISAGSIRSVRAASVSGATILLTQGFAPTGLSLGKLTAAGAINNTNIRSNGNIGTIAALSLSNSTIYAGVNPPDGGALPDSEDDFASAATIRGVSIRNRAAPSFLASNVAASVLGRMNLGVVQTTNGGVPFGVAAQTLTSLSATDVARARIRAARFSEPSQSLELGDFKVRIF
jgi:cyclophilin family peptidyl-prolyl cis-trans isomerase